MHALDVDEAYGTVLLNNGALVEACGEYFTIGNLAHISEQEMFKIELFVFVICFVGAKAIHGTHVTLINGKDSELNYVPGQEVQLNTFCQRRRLLSE